MREATASYYLRLFWNGPLVVDLSIFILSVARRLKTKEKQKKRKAYEPKLTPEGNPFTLSSLHWIFPVRMKLIKSHLIFFFPHSLPEMMDSSTFKRFSLSIDNIFENLEDVDFTAQGGAIYLFCCCRVGTKTLSVLE